MYTLRTALSTVAAATTTRGTGAGAGIGTAMSAGSACHLCRCKVRAPRRSLQRREELEISSLQLWACPHVPLFVHFTWGHDQHLITAVSDPNECSILPPGTQRYLSCNSQSNWNEIHSFSKVNQLSEVHQHAVRKLCDSHYQLDTLTSAFPHAPRGTPRLDALQISKLHSLLQRTLHHSSLSLCFTQWDFIGTI